jgi:hypothetical protein
MNPRFCDGLEFEYKRKVSSMKGLARGVEDGGGSWQTFVCIFNFVFQEGEKVLEGHFWQVSGPTRPWSCGPLGQVRLVHGRKSISDQGGLPHL